MADTGEQAGRESSASQQPPEPPPDDQVPPIVVPAVPAIDMNVPGLTMHMYQPIPDSAPSANGSEEAPRKRRQVKVACTNCQKACKRCDDSRPCSRCIHYGIVDTCVDSGRKERRKGLKRGPYKKRDGKGTGMFQRTDTWTRSNICQRFRSQLGSQRIAPVYPCYDAATWTHATPGSRPPHACSAVHGSDGLPSPCLLPVRA